MWPFRRKDTIAEQPSPPEEETAEPEIDHLDWGIRLGMLERYERAAERFRLAVQAYPDDPAGHYNLALALDQAGYHDQARDSYNQALQVDPDLPDAHINLGLALFDLGDAGAVDALQTALKLDAEDAVGHYDLGCVYMAGRRWKKAVTEFRESVKADPKDARTRFNLAIALRRAGDVGNAESELRDFLALARGRYPEQQEYVTRLLGEEYGGSGEGHAP